MMTRKHVIAVFITGALSSASGLAQQTESEEDIVHLSPFEVTTDTDQGYVSTHSIGGTRINIPILEIPNSIIVLNRQLLDDVAADYNYFEAAKFVSGVNVASSPGNGQLTIRGYNVSISDSVRDGIRAANTNLGSGNPESFTYERVEVIKGPMGVLYGSHDLGGVINYVSKKPLPTRHTRLGASFGSDSFFRFELDHNGLAGQDDKFRYRVAVMEQQGERHWGGASHRDSRVVLASASYEVTDRIRAWGTVEFTESHISDQESQLWADPDGNIADFIGYDRVIDEMFLDRPDRNTRWFYETGLSGSFDAFGERWDYRVLGRTSKNVYDGTITDKNGFNYMDANGNTLMTPSGENATYRNTTFAALFANPAWYSGGEIIGQVIVPRSTRDQAGTSEADSMDFDLTGNFGLGPTTHKFLTYAGWAQGESIQRRVRYLIPSIDIITPVYSSNPQDDWSSPVLQLYTTGESDGWHWGISDNVGLFDDKLTIVGSARYNNGESTSRDLRLDTVNTEENSIWQYKYGLVYKLQKGIALFASHNETNTPRNGVDEAGNRATDFEGTADEIGVKLDLLENTLVLTGSYFDMVLDGFQSSEFVFQPDGTQIRVFVDAGSQNTDGYEMDLTWQPTKNFSMIAAYGNLESRATNGNRFRHVSEGSNYKAFAKYSFLDGAVNGLSLGLGYQFTNERAADGGDSFSLPSFDTWEAMVSYRRENWTLQLNVSNLLDKYYPASSINNTRIYLGDPRLFRLRLGYNF